MDLPLEMVLINDYWAWTCKTCSKVLANAKDTIYPNFELKAHTEICDIEPVYVFG
jgi:hypothetical protein